MFYRNLVWNFDPGSKSDKVIKYGFCTTITLTSALVCFTKTGKFSIIFMKIQCRGLRV